MTSSAVQRASIVDATPASPPSASKPPLLAVVPPMALATSAGAHALLVHTPLSPPSPSPSPSAAAASSVMSFFLRAPDMFPVKAGVEECAGAGDSKPVAAAAAAAAVSPAAAVPSDGPPSVGPGAPPLKEESLISLYFQALPANYPFHSSPVHLCQCSAMAGPHTHTLPKNFAMPLNLQQSVRAADTHDEEKDGAGGDTNSAAAAAAVVSTPSIATARTPVAAAARMDDSPDAPAGSVSAAALATAAALQQQEKLAQQLRLIEQTISMLDATPAKPEPAAAAATAAGTGSGPVAPHVGVHSGTNVLGRNVVIAGASSNNTVVSPLMPAIPTVVAQVTGAVPSVSPSSASPAVSSLHASLATLQQLSATRDALDSSIKNLASLNEQDGIKHTETPPPATHAPAAPATLAPPAAPVAPKKSPSKSPTAPDRTQPVDLSCQSIIECGELHTAPDGTAHRVMTAFVPFFNREVEVYQAVVDPLRRPLYRASAIAEKFGYATNRVGMYLARRRSANTGIFQATAFRSKPQGRSGLKAGGYFLTMDACLDFEAHFRQTDEMIGIPVATGLTTSGINAVAAAAAAALAASSTAAADAAPSPASHAQVQAQLADAHQLNVVMKHQLHAASTTSPVSSAVQSDASSSSEHKDGEGSATMQTEPVDTTAASSRRKTSRKKRAAATAAAVAAAAAAALTASNGTAAAAAAAAAPVAAAEAATATPSVCASVVPAARMSDAEASTHLAFLAQFSTEQRRLSEVAAAGDDKASASPALHKKRSAAEAQLHSASPANGDADAPSAPALSKRSSQRVSSESASASSRVQHLEPLKLEVGTEDSAMIGNHAGAIAGLSPLSPLSPSAAKPALPGIDPTAVARFQMQQQQQPHAFHPQHSPPAPQQMFSRDGDLVDLHYAHHSHMSALQMQQQVANQQQMAMTHAQQHLLMTHHAQNTINQQQQQQQQQQAMMAHGMQWHLTGPNRVTAPYALSAPAPAPMLLSPLSNYSPYPPSMLSPGVSHMQRQGSGGGMVLSPSPMHPGAFHHGPYTPQQQLLHPHAMGHLTPSSFQQQQHAAMLSPYAAFHAPTMMLHTPGPSFHGAYAPPPSSSPPMHAMMMQPPSPSPNPPRLPQ